MGWTGLPAAANTDWTDVNFREQFAEAIRERDWAVDNNSWSWHTMPSVGDDCQARYAISGEADYVNIASLQGWIQMNASKFCPSGSHVGVTTKPAYTLATLWAEAGINASGYIRKYPREISSTSAYGESGWRARLTGSGSATYYEYTTTWTVSSDQESPADVVITYGTALVGDYIGYWQFNEIKACLELLTCIPITATNSSPGSIKGGSTWGIASTYAAAKTAIESDWASDPDPTSAWLWPTAWISGSYPYNGDYWIRTERTTCSFTLSPRSSDDLGRADCDVTYYIIGEESYSSSGGEFSNHGDDIEDGTAVVADVQSGVDGGTADIVSDRWNADNDNVLPNSPYADDPTTPGYTEMGYKTKEVFGIMDFGITGGFEYT